MKLFHVIYMPLADICQKMNCVLFVQNYSLKMLKLIPHINHYCVQCFEIMVL